MIAGDLTFLAGGVYRSRFLRALCACPDILAFCSEQAGTPLAAHSPPSQQLYTSLSRKCGALGGKASARICSIRLSRSSWSRTAARII